MSGVAGRSASWQDLHCSARYNSPHIGLLRLYFEGSRGEIAPLFQLQSFPGSKLFVSGAAFLWSLLSLVFFCVEEAAHRLNNGSGSMVYRPGSLRRLHYGPNLFWSSLRVHCRLCREADKSGPHLAAFRAARCVILFGLCALALDPCLTDI